MAKKPRKPRGMTPAEASFSQKYPKTFAKMYAGEAPPKAPRKPRGMTPAKAAAVAAYTKEFGKAPPARMTASVMLQRVGHKQSLSAELRSPRMATGPSNAELVRKLQATAMAAKRLDAPTAAPRPIAVSPGPLHGPGVKSVGPLHGPGVKWAGQIPRYSGPSDMPRTGRGLMRPAGQRYAIAARRFAGGLAATVASTVLRHNGHETASEVMSTVAAVQTLRGIEAIAPRQFAALRQSPLKLGLSIAALGVGYVAYRLAAARSSSPPATPEGVRSGRIDAARDAARAAAADHGQTSGRGPGSVAAASDGMTAGYQRRNPRGGTVYVREYQTPVRAG